MIQLEKYLKKIKEELLPFDVDVLRAGRQIKFITNAAEFICQISETDNQLPSGEIRVMPLDLLVREPKKITGMVLSRLHLNVVIYARNCEVKRIEKKTARHFLNEYHLMNSTESAFNYGLFYKDELVCVAAFSKGRKMNRLSEDERSFELIRFCTKSRTSVAGGLTKLLDHFIREKKAGDIMTYIDLQLSDGNSFVRAGFKKHSETRPQFFLVNRETFERTVLKDIQAPFDNKKFYSVRNSGNVKLVYKAKIGIK